MIFRRRVVLEEFNGYDEAFPAAEDYELWNRIAAQWQPFTFRDQPELGPVVMDFYATSLERGLATRDQLDPARFIDLWHDDFVRDGLRAIERIYDHFERALTTDTRTAMEATLARNPRHRHGAHEYSLENYGLTAGDVRERFTAYADRFDLAWD